MHTTVLYLLPPQEKILWIASCYPKLTEPGLQLFTLLLLLDAKVSFCEADRHWAVGQIDWSALAHQKDLNSICLWWLQFPGWTKSPCSSLPRSLSLSQHPFLAQELSFNFITQQGRFMPCHICLSFVPCSIHVNLTKAKKDLFLKHWLFQISSVCLVTSKPKSFLFKEGWLAAWVASTMMQVGTFRYNKMFFVCVLKGESKDIIKSTQKYSPFGYAV